MAARWCRGLLCSLCGLLALLASTGVGAQALEPAQAERYERMIRELRCLVCQNQTIADSSAPLAEDLRQQVRSQIAAGRSDDQIRDYVTQRYGEFVLYRPRLSARTALLWGGPPLLALIGLMVAFGFVRRASRAGSAQAVDEQALRRLLDEER